METHGLPNFPSLVDVPAFKTLSSLRILARKRRRRHFGYHFGTVTTNFLIRAEGQDGFQLFYQTLYNREVASVGAHSTYTITLQQLGRVCAVVSCLVSVGLTVRGHSAQPLLAVV